MSLKMTSLTPKCMFPLLVILLQFSDSTALFTYGFTVHVINQLPQQITLHCASKDDDFGFHQLSQNQELRWYFHRNFWLSTMYFCHFWRQSKDRRFEVFNYTVSEACRFDQLEVDNNTCVWAVKDDGFYFGNRFPVQQLTKIHDW